MAGPFLIGRNRVVIDAPAQRVFDYLADLRHIAYWSGETDFHITRVPQDPPGKGSQIRWERSGEMQGPLILRGGMGDSQVTLEKLSSITLYEPLSALAIETRNTYNGLLHSIEKFTFGFQEEPNGTLVTMVSEMEAMVPSIFIGPIYAIRLVRGSIERMLGGRLAGILPSASAGSHLSRVKEKTEAPEPASRS